MEVSIVLPCYEEAENLRQLLPSLHARLRPLGLAYEIMVVDSLTPRDHSADLCREHHAVYLNQEEKPGYGAAVRTGIKHARGRYTLFMDADGTHDHADIPKMLSLRHEYDVIIGSRYIEPHASNRSIPLFLLSKLTNWAYTLVLGLPFKDITGSFKLYRTQALQQVQLTADNFDIIEEMLCRLMQKNPGLKVKELPITWQDRRFGKTKRAYGALILAHIKTLIRLRFRH